MFTKENIIIQNDTLGFLNPKCDMTDYEKNTNDLYELVTKIIEELHIISLLKVTVRDVNLFEKEGGRAVFTINNHTVSSEIEISRKTYVQFNNENNIELKNEALATIYHELYHIFDRETLYSKFKDLQIPSNEYQYYKIGIQYWSEFFAYYKTKELYMSDYPILQFNSVYSKMRQNDPSQNAVEDFFYIVSNISAYMKNQQYIRELENDTYFKYFKKDVSYDDLVEKLNTIMQIYPENVNNIEDFISLGKMYCKLMEHFWYKIKFNHKNNMIIQKYSPFLSPI